MAYEGGTKLVSLRINDALWRKLENECNNKGAAVNAALEMLKHDYEFDMLKTATKYELRDHYARPIGEGFSSTHTKMRIRLHFVEWCEMQQIHLNRVVNIAIRDYVGRTAAHVVTMSGNNDPSATEPARNVTTYQVPGITTTPDEDDERTVLITIQFSRELYQRLENRGLSIQRFLDAAVKKFQKDYNARLIDIELLGRLRGIPTKKYPPLYDTMPVNIRENVSIQSWLVSDVRFIKSTFYHYAAQRYYDYLYQYPAKMQLIKRLRR